MINKLRAARELLHPFTLFCSLFSVRFAEVFIQSLYTLHKRVLEDSIPCEILKVSSKQNGHLSKTDT